MKPIEPGCRCIITADKYTPSNIGNVVVAKYFVPANQPVSAIIEGTVNGAEIGPCGWIVEGDIYSVAIGPLGRIIAVDGFIHPTYGRVKTIVGEYRLMRIDGDEFDDNPYNEKILRGDGKHVVCKILHNDQF